MPIDFTCPHCGATTRVADQYVGRSGPCAQCGRMVTVTPAGSMPGYAPARARSGMPGWVIALIVLGVLAVLAMLAIPCSGILIAILLPAVQSARDVGREATCMSHLQQIGMAIMNYDDQRGHLPPPFEPDENGRPVHSWRVLLLPYLGEHSLYESYARDEPWDGPQNSRLSDMMPDVFRCPSDSGDSAAARTSETSYVMLVGPGTPFDGPRPPALADLQRRGETILVVELHASGINWLEPRDMTVEELRDLLDSGRAGPGRRTNHPRGINVLFADGSVQTLPEEELLMRLEALRAEAAVMNQWPPGDAGTD